MLTDQPASLPSSHGSSPHIIRLHGPWQYEALAHTKLGPSGASIDVAGELPPSGTMKIPANWAASLGTDFRGRVLYKRRFGRPTNLKASERIDLVTQSVNGHAIIRLNDSNLGEIEIGASANRFDLSNKLLPRNELHIEVDLPRGYDGLAVGGIVGDIFLEIYDVNS
ncbi:MAG: hypothetical protein H8E66_15200 [Planctomycetes bacterium]|nr:hypothetical protein [Planctomycetota bacterium]